MADEKYTIEITIKGKDDISKAADTSKGSLQSLADIAKGITAAAMITMAKRAAQATAEVIKLGAASLASRNRLVAFAGGAAEADEMMQALIEGSDGAIDKMTAMTRSSLLLEQGLVSNAREMELVGAAVSKLGNRTWSTERKISSLTLVLGVKGSRRMDDFGLSTEKATIRAAELEAQGIASQKAWSTAVLEQVAEATDTLGDTSGLLATQLDILTAAQANLNQVMGVGTASLLTQLDVMPLLIEKTNDLTATVDQLFKLGGAGIAFWQSMHKSKDVVVAIAAMNATLAKSVLTLDELNPEMQRYAATTDLVTEAIVKRTVATEEELAVMQRERDAMEATRWMANWRAQQEVEAVAAMQDNQEEIEEATRDHQERLKDIYESGQQSFTQIAQDAHQQRLDDLNAAMQAQLEALAKSISARKFQESLEAMEQRHQDRIASIRNQARESDKEREDRRFRAIMDQLDQEQQARMQALRLRHGKDTTAADRVESLEEEHRRRMAGLFTDSARAKEVKRHEDALAEQAFQDEEAALLEQFEDEKEAAELAHANELAAIDAQRIADALAAEEARYLQEVQRAQTARAQQQTDQDARQAIEATFAAEQAQLERDLAIEIAGIQATALQDRIDAENTAFATMLSSMGSFISDMATAAEKDPIEIPVVLLPPPIVAGQHWEDYLSGLGIPGRAEGGAASGLTIVGEKGPELLNLPGGSWITPMGGAGGGGGRGGGGVTIINHFGAGSVRSDRDVRRIAEDQEKSLRLMGQGVLN